MLYENLQLEERRKNKVFPETISHQPKITFEIKEKINHDIILEEEKSSMNLSIKSKDNRFLRNPSNNTNTIM